MKETTGEKEEEETNSGSEESTVIDELTTRYDMRTRRSNQYYGRTNEDRAEHKKLVDSIMEKDEVNAEKKTMTSMASSMLHQAAEFLITNTFKDAALISQKRNDGTVRAGDFNAAFRIGSKRRKRKEQTDGVKEDKQRGPRSKKPKE